MTILTQASPYYSLTSFTFFVPVAVLYAAASNLFFAITRRKNTVEQMLPPTTTTTGDKSEQRMMLAIVTGCNTGIGYETARTLAVDYGYTVVMACRSRDKAQAAADTINNQQQSLSCTATGKRNGQAVFVHPLDLSSFDSVRSFCEQFKSSYPNTKIHVLVNNAGRSTTGVSSSEQDLDLLFQSNFLGHFLLTSLLMENMADNARIVNLSSVMHHFCGQSAIDSVAFWKTTATTAADDTYSLSKLAAVLFTIQLNQHYPNIRSIAVNPGAVYVE
jgi:NAD(P)-dependent dehydrogenase (short-subunit alcohol dehydrogenase family)